MRLILYEVAVTKHQPHAGKCERLAFMESDDLFFIAAYK